MLPYPLPLPPLWTPLPFTSSGHRPHRFAPTTVNYKMLKECSHLITDRNVLRESRGVSKHIWKLASGGGGIGGGGRGGGGGKQWQQHCPAAAHGVAPLLPLSRRLPKPMTANPDGVRLRLAILTRACTDEQTPCSATMAWNVPRHSLSNNTRSLTGRRRWQPLLFPGNNMLINARKLCPRTHKLALTNEKLSARINHGAFTSLTTQYYHSKFQLNNLTDSDKNNTQWKTWLF
jgi:hypothetical protein